MTQGGRYEYCALFVHSEDRESLLRIATDALGGQPAGRHLTAAGMTVSLVRNKGGVFRTDDFATWPLKFEIEQGEADDATTLRLVRSLLTALRQRDVRVVAACSYEDELPPQTFAG